MNELQAQCNSILLSYGRDADYHDLHRKDKALLRSAAFESYPYLAIQAMAYVPDKTMGLYFSDMAKHDKAADAYNGFDSYAFFMDLHAVTDCQDVISVIEAELEECSRGYDALIAEKVEYDASMAEHNAQYGSLGQRQAE